MSEVCEKIKFNIQCRKLLVGLKKVSGVIENAQVMQILSCVKIKMHGSVMLLTASDSDIEISAEIHDNTFDFLQPVNLAVPGKKIFDICRSLPANDELSFELNGSWLTIQSGKSQFKLMSMPVEQFPMIDFAEAEAKLALPQNQVMHALQQTSFAMAVHDVRQFLNGMLLDFKPGQVRLVATDGHRLSLSEIACESSIELKKIVPRKAIIELVKLLEDGDGSIMIELANNKIRFTSDAGQLVTGLIQGDYPDYSRLLPDAQSCSVLLDVQALKSALVRASILSHDRFKAASFHFSDRTLVIESENAQHENIHEEIQLMSSVESLSIAFNIVYIMDVLNNLDADALLFEATTGQKAVTLKPSTGGFVVHVVMPLTL